MTERLKGWVTPSTITTVASLLFSVGSFVGISNYRAQAQERQLEEFKASFADQIRGLKTDTSQRMDKMEARFAGADADGKETARLEERNRALEAQLAGLRDDVKVVSLMTQALGRDLAGVKARQSIRSSDGKPDDRFSDIHQDRKEKP